MRRTSVARRGEQSKFSALLNHEVGQTRNYGYIVNNDNYVVKSQ